jgi:chromosome segregation ATPase
MEQSYGGDTMATVTVRRKPSYAELEAKVKELEDALVIAEKNKCLRDIGWDMLHNQIAELQRQNRGLRVDLSNARKLNEELSDQVEADEREIADLKASKEILREFREELGQEVDEANRVIAEMATELTELKADRNIALAEIERLKGELAQKDKINDTSFKATNELAELLVAAQRERDEAREEAGNYRVELMERDCRVDELEKRNEWLFHEMEQWKQSAENYQCAAIAFQEDLEKLRTAYDTLYERSADNYTNAQYWEEQAHKLEEEIDTLRRQLKANEESYMALRAMYEELRDAATGLVSHIRTNTFAN